MIEEEKNHYKAEAIADDLNKGEIWTKTDYYQYRQKIS